MTAHAPLLPRRVPRSNSVKKPAPPARTAFLLHQGVLYPMAEADVCVREAGKPYGGTSLGMLANHPLREWFIHAARNPWLTRLVLLVIMFNCTAMLFEPHMSSAQHQHITTTEWTSMGIFTVELILKLLAHGLVCHEGAYLHDPWNLLDLAVVLPFWVLLAFPNVPSLAPLQLVRPLRPLRTLQAFPELRRVVVAFLKAVPALSSVLGLTAFFFIITGIVGVELYQGVLHLRCLPSYPHEHMDVSTTHLFNAVTRAEQPATTYCADNASVCADGDACVDFDNNPRLGGGSFDSMKGAAIIILRAITFDNWSDPMYTLTQALPSMATFT